MYFSTNEMRQALSGWPEIVFIDMTYKLLKRGLSVMIIAIRDANRATQIVGVCLLVDEKASTLKAVLNHFKTINEEACNKIVCFMTDKDMTERPVIKKVFPKASLCICEFHVLKTFSSKITTAGMKISVEKRDIILDILNKLTKSRSETEYDVLYKKLCDTAPESVLKYFNKNWHNIRNEWTRYSLSRNNFGDYTNNPVESTNARMKDEIKPHSTFKDFLDGFFRYYNRRNDLLKYNAGQDIYKRYLRGFARGSDEYLYENYLTPAAFKKVFSEFKRRQPMTFMEISTSQKICWIRCGFTVLRCSIDSCECNDYTSNNLPCRHIFATRQQFKLPLFDRNLCAERWTKHYNMEHQPMLQHLSKSLSKSLSVKSPSAKSPSSISPFQMHQIKTPALTPSNQIRKEFDLVCTNLKNHGNLASKNERLIRLNLLRQIDYAWCNNIKVDLKESTLTNIEKTQNKNYSHDMQTIDGEIVSLPAKVKVAGRPKNLTKCTVQYPSSNKKRKSLKS